MRNQEMLSHKHVGKKQTKRLFRDKKNCNIVIQLKKLQSTENKIKIRTYGHFEYFIDIHQLNIEDTNGSINFLKNTCRYIFYIIIL